MRARDDIAQRLYLVQELELSIALIETGLALLQRSRSHNTEPFVFLILLSTGVERLMKIILHLHALKTTGSPLPERDLRDIGHDIIRLRQRVVDECFTSEYLRRSVAQQDLDFIQHDLTFNEMLTLMSDFARRDRYIP